MKIKLLGTGNYVGVSAIPFPVIVEACLSDTKTQFLVRGEELLRVGGDARAFKRDLGYRFLPEEVEVLPVEPEPAVDYVTVTTGFPGLKTEAYTIDRTLPVGTKLYFKPEGV